MTPKERLDSLGPPPVGRGGMSDFSLCISTGKLLELLEAQRNDALEEAAEEARVHACAFNIRAAFTDSVSNMADYGYASKSIRLLEKDIRKLKT